jgi:hypothetical protein
MELVARFCVQVKDTLEDQSTMKRLSLHTGSHGTRGTSALTATERAVLHYGCGMHAVPFASAPDPIQETILAYDELNRTRELNGPGRQVASQPRALTRVATARGRHSRCAPLHTRVPTCAEVSAE